MDSDATVREPEGASRQTVREGGMQGTVRESAAPASSSVNRPKFRDYEILQQLPTSGSESDIYVVGRGADQFILKLYRYKIEPRIDVLEKIKNLGEMHPHELVRVFEFGFDEETQRWFEIQEYVRSGSLRRIIDGISQVGEEWRNVVFLSLLREVSRSLKLLHENGILHLDLKPANVLARTLDPIDFVLIDFGISNTLAPELSKKFTAVRGTPMYQSPESWSGAVGVPSDWWSLGMLALEIAAGKHPFEGLSQQVVASLLMTKAVEMPETIPVDKREILHGLLTRDTSRRWGYDQVSRWLAGERNIPVHFEKPAAGSARMLAFMGQSHTSLETLARAIAVDEASWAKGRELLMRGHIRTWLEGNGEFEQAVDVDSLVKDVQDPDEKLFRFVHYYGKPLPFVFMGKAITFGNLLLFLGRNVRREGQSKAEIVIIQKIHGGKLSSMLDFYLQCNSSSQELRELRRVFPRIRGETSQVAFDYLSAIAVVRKTMLPEQFVELCKTGVMSVIEASTFRSIKDKDGNTALMHALANGGDHPEVISALLNAGADVNATNADDITAPMLAVRSDCNPEAIRVLLEAGGEVVAEDAIAYVARHPQEGTAAYRRLKDISDSSIKVENKRLFIEIGIIIVIVAVILAIASFRGSFMYETRNPESKVGRELMGLVKKGTDVNARDNKGWSPLMHAVVSRPEAVSMLIEKGADVNVSIDIGYGPVQGRTALMFAAEKNADPEILRLLIEKGADVNARDRDGNTPLAWAATQGSPEVAALLVQSGADINARDNRGRTPLMTLLAYSRGRIGDSLKAASLLIDNGADVNARDNDGRTALMLEVSGGTLEGATFLVEQGASVNAKDNSGRTPLMHAVAWGNRGSPELSSFLIQKGANINTKDNNGWTPLMYAATSENEAGPELVSLLIQDGAEINAKDNGGRTALMHAAGQKSEPSSESVSLLLLKGATVNAKDNGGKTALSLAQSDAVKRLLRSAGGVE